MDLLPIELVTDVGERPPFSVERKEKVKEDSDVTTVRDEDTISHQTQTEGFRQILSQPSRGVTHRDRMLWLQKRRVPGLYVQCNQCNKWRYMPHIIDRQQLPNKWYCKMNPDTNFATCTEPERPLCVRPEEDLIYNKYSAGSIVWACLRGWPWWPAMVDDCPDAEQFYWLDGVSKIPVEYHVVFFDVEDVQRAWIPVKRLRPFFNIDKVFMKKMTNDKRFEDAIKQATVAESMPLATRLAKYSFIARYQGNINPPPKPSRFALRKFQREMKRKFKVDYPLESSSDSEDDVPLANLTRAPRNNNTPKKPKEAGNSQGDLVTDLIYQRFKK